MPDEIEITRALRDVVSEHLALARAMHNVGTEIVHHLPARSEKTGAIHVARFC
jgi:hypothetical protein